MSTVAIAHAPRLVVGRRPDWEVDGKILISPNAMDVDVVNPEDDSTKLKRISEPSAFIFSPAIQKWLSSPPFVRFSTRPRTKGTVEIPQPPHTLTLLGRCDVEIGPHVFMDTKIIEVTYDPSTPSLSQVPSTSTTDVLMEFREASTERFLIPLDCSIIERILRLGVPPTILLSTVIAAPPSNSTPQFSFDQIPQHPLTIHFVHAGTPLWEAMQKRVISSKMPIQTVQLLLERAVKAPISRAYLPHRLPDGPLLKGIKEYMASIDKYDAKPMVLKDLRIATNSPATTPTSGTLEPPAKRKKMSTNATVKASAPTPPHSNINRFGRKTTSFNLAGEKESDEDEADLVQDADATQVKKLHEKRVKIPCSTCGKTIARKVEHVGKEDFKPLCRNCASDARKAKDLARSLAYGAPAQRAHPTSGVGQPRPVPQRSHMQVEVVIPPRIPYRPLVPWPGAGTALGAASAHPAAPSSFSLFSPRPPPAPSSLAVSASGAGRGMSPVPLVGAGRGRGMTPTYYQPAGGPPGSAKPVIPMQYSNPYSAAAYSYSYKPMPPPVPGMGGARTGPLPSSGPGTGPLSSGSGLPRPSAVVPRATAAAAVPPTLPAAHPYTGRYYTQPVTEGYSWRPTLYPTTGPPYGPVPSAGVGRGAGRGTTPIPPGPSTSTPSMKNATGLTAPSTPTAPVKATSGSATTKRPEPKPKLMRSSEKPI